MTTRAQQKRRSTPHPSAPQSAVLLRSRDARPSPATHDANPPTPRPRRRPSVVALATHEGRAPHFCFRVDSTLSAPYDGCRRCEHVRGTASCVAWLHRPSAHVGGLHSAMSAHHRSPHARYATPGRMTTGRNPRGRAARPQLSPKYRSKNSASLSSTACFLVPWSLPAENRDTGGRIRVMAVPDVGNCAVSEGVVDECARRLSVESLVGDDLVEVRGALGCNERLPFLVDCGVDCERVDELLDEVLLVAQATGWSRRRGRSRHGFPCLRRRPSSRYLRTSIRT